MPDMSIKGSPSPYGSSYSQSLTRSNQSSETSKSNLANKSSETNKSSLANKSSETKNSFKNEATDKAEKKDSTKTELSDSEKSTLQQMKAIEKEVIAHEQAHKSAGGSIAGAATYSYSMGPDGKRYISGGEVSIQTPATEDKEKKVKLLDRVKQAALAPAQPSPQDIRVAAGATAEQQQLNAALQRERGLKAYGGESKKNQQALESSFNQVG